MNVPFIDLRAQFATIRGDVMSGIEKVIGNTSFILGPDVAELEKSFAAFCECTHAIGVASGLDAIKLALRSLNIGPGDEVITAANTFIATTLAVSSVGATPVLVDIDPRYYNIDPAKIEAAITPRTKVILPVHLYGQPADMDPILEIAKKHKLWVVEDAAQAHGARYKGSRVGSFGILAAFSLYPGKNLGAYGDGGLITTNDDRLAEVIQSMHNYGSKVKYYHDTLGENSRLDSIQAAVVKAKLPHLDRWNEARRRVAARYTEKLRGIPGVVTPTILPGVEPVFHLYVIRVPNRDGLMEHLKQKGVGAIIHYPIPIHLQKAYASRGWRKGDFPITEEYAGQILSLPMYAEITEEQVDYVVEQIRSFH